MAITAQKAVTGKKLSIPIANRLASIPPPCRENELMLRTEERTSESILWLRRTPPTTETTPNTR